MEKEFVNYNQALKLKVLGYLLLTQRKVLYILAILIYYLNGVQHQHSHKHLDGLERSTIYITQ